MRHDFTTHLSVAAAAARFIEVLEAKGLTLFAHIDHQAAAEKAGLSLAATQVVIYGNPKIGTPLMQQSPSLALDLPLKVLFAEQNGQTHIIFEESASLLARHDISPETGVDLAKGEALIFATFAT